MIIVNADDWGRSRAETDAAAACYRNAAITSVSAMVFMDDSSRAAELANALRMDVGLHLNLTQAFSANASNRLLNERQARIAAFLNSSKYAGLLYNPSLRASFRHVCEAQLDEFVRLYGRLPSHIDGHHHQHLCTNLLLENVFPSGTKVRRSFHFWPGEKSIPNRVFRSFIDLMLRRRYRLVDYFFALSQCLGGDRMTRVCDLARTYTVELMAHPANAAEQRYLASNEYHARIGRLEKGTYATL